jgi:hypothetical protein
LFAVDGNPWRVLLSNTGVAAWAEAVPTSPTGLVIIERATTAASTSAPALAVGVVGRCVRLLTITLLRLLVGIVIGCL